MVLGCLCEVLQRLASLHIEFRQRFIEIGSLMMSRRIRGIEPFTGITNWVSKQWGVELLQVEMLEHKLGLCSVKKFSNERKGVNVVSKSSIRQMMLNDVEVCWSVGRDKRCRTGSNKVEISDENKVIWWVWMKSERRIKLRVSDEVEWSQSVEWGQRYG
jgi:hypothetical protein